ncbi:signal recognition particle 9 kDa protein-domain-containing protein [Paecilomyces variotii]|uniref:Signal recognition particle 9 kDa protein-domain-containing protein n=1 Tax=Byssochlamys spectabilis TaxID=264951 RepID=A0A443I6W3_BYSSP|nr:signal recognition particle 9 kDa protein-domain-containing protein [Paecilomyces variotii]KAJ9364210.1 hypothetical protein DTO280E4_1973 [Paecilomyces variotii]RWQ99726.1 signal recognition particle 9 kDa protein-domain-containing protein [Paecilomyces variotii]
MPYLPSSQAFLEQSSLLLEAYPESTKITTRYSYPSRSPKSHPRSKPKITDPAATTTADSNATTTTTPVATLTLKTWHPPTGICLKYKTNKAAEVGRLITGLGKLAAGAKVKDLGTSATAPVGAGEDVEMADAPTAAAAVVVDDSAAAATATVVKTDSAGAKGGKSKKKGGKGKR